MSTIAKRKQKLQERLGKIRGHRSSCWVCHSPHGVKTSRVSYGARCTRCIRDGLTTPEVEEYDRLKAELERITKRS